MGRPRSRARSRASSPGSRPPARSRRPTATSGSSDFNAAKRAAKRLPRGTTRKTELTGVVGLVEGIAARKRLTGPRLVPLWLTLDTQPRLLDDPHVRAVHAPHLVPRLPARLAVLPRPGPAVPPARQLRQAQRAVVGEGRRGGRPDADRAARAARPARRRRRLGVLLRVRRRPAAVGVRHRPGHGACSRWRGWPSGSAARTRCCRCSSRRSASSRRNTPEGVRVPTSDGAEYALYSFAPDLHVINGFVQALVGLYDLGKIAGDPDAQALYTEGERVARRELPTLRHRRLVAVLARLGRARVRPLLPPAAARRSCTTCARAPTIPSTATPSCASPSTSSRRRWSRWPPRTLRGGTLGKVQCPAVEDLARRAEVLARRQGRSLASPRCVVGHGTPALLLERAAQGGRLRRRAHRRRPGG